jgi:hypothetical protein
MEDDSAASVGAPRIASRPSHDHACIPAECRDAVGSAGGEVLTAVVGRPRERERLDRAEHVYVFGTGGLRRHPRALRGEQVVDDAIDCRMKTLPQKCDVHLPTPFFFGQVALL